MQNVVKKSLVWIIESFILRDICFINVNVMQGSEQGIINFDKLTHFQFMLPYYGNIMPISRM